MNGALEATLAAWTPALTRIRRDLHAHPETAFEEHRTAAIVAAELRRLGIETHEGIAGTGVIGVLRNGASTRAIGLRADMDALPMQEENVFAHRSVHAGKFGDGAHARLAALAPMFSPRGQGRAAGIRP